MGTTTRRSAPLTPVVMLALVLFATVSCGSDSPPPAASVELDGERIEIARHEVDEVVTVVRDDVVVRSILFQDESVENVRAIVTRQLVLQAIADILSPGTIDPAALQERRDTQHRALWSELVFFNELDPEGRADVLVEELRPWLDPAAVVYLKRTMIDNFDTRAASAVVTIDPTIGRWDADDLRVRKPLPEGEDQAPGTARPLAPTTADPRQ